MGTVALLTDEKASPQARAVFDDIRKTRGTAYINNFWRALANNPEQLQATWQRLKTVMANGALDPLTKEMIYIAVSIANACSYCVHSHTAAARAKGMSAAQHAELLAIIGLAGKTNQLANALQLPVDDAFDALRA